MVVFLALFVPWKCLFVRYSPDRILVYSCALLSLYSMTGIPPYRVFHLRMLQRRHCRVLVLTDSQSYTFSFSIKFSIPCSIRGKLALTRRRRPTGFVNT
ncbi:hypothetical protein DFH94DRAFT_769239 [Russula ochroleuca]|uniref:Uncharacterized protein n=1 Tax=Russula ochroleuca TaxID=152965 RepID=A0A9P5MR47_9AGAM|nr:hypothetical protein DFH94DRAFT_769239 [Russula ochroleuca]